MYTHSSMYICTYTCMCDFYYVSIYVFIYKVYVHIWVCMCMYLSSKFQVPVGILIQVDMYKYFPPFLSLKEKVFSKFLDHKNHRTISKIILLQPPFYQTKFLRVSSSLLNTFRRGELTNLLVNLLQFLITATVKNFFLVSKPNTTLLCNILPALVKSPSLQALIRYWKIVIRSSQSLLFSMVKNFSCLNLLSQKRSSSPVILVVFLWTHSNRSIYFLC